MDISTITTLFFLGILLIWIIIFLKIFNLIKNSKFSKNDILKLSFTRLRENLEFFGIDTSHLNNEEIKDRIVKSVKLYSLNNLTTEQASNNMNKMAKILREHI